MTVTAKRHETLRVCEDDDGKLHVELADIMDEAESWGNYLADIARTIVRDHALLTERENEDLLADIADGFNTWLQGGHSFSHQLQGIKLAKKK